MGDFIDWAFLYGAGMSLTSFACALDTAFLPLAQKSFMDAFNTFIGLINRELRYDDMASFGERDLEALQTTGLTERDIDDITHPQGLPLSPETSSGQTHESPAVPDGATQPVGEDPTEYSARPECSFDTSTVIIPINPGEGMRYDYELTYYVNDISYTNTQVASEFGKRMELKDSFTYGRERLGAVDGSGQAVTFYYDGRGSVAQMASEGNISSSLRYDPFGEVVSGIKPYELTFAHNAEEYNPVSGLTYLRARYYENETAGFLTKDNVLGHIASLNSQNRYAFAESDPVNNYDPSGHAIGSSAYEYQMEAQGGINEIYNAYVGTSLQNSYYLAASAFYSQLNYAYGVNPTNLAAINSISGISQATANAYISYGASMALYQGASWGCVPGALTGAAINTFATHVNATKDSVNVQIAEVQSYKYGQYAEYQAYLAWLAYVYQQEQAAASAGGKAGKTTVTNNNPGKYSPITPGKAPTYMPPPPPPIYTGPGKAGAPPPVNTAPGKAGSPSPVCSVPGKAETPSPVSTAPGKAVTPSPVSTAPGKAETPSPVGTAPGKAETPSPVGTAPGKADLPPPSSKTNQPRGQSPQDTTRAPTPDNPSYPGKSAGPPRKAGPPAQIRDVSNPTSSSRDLARFIADYEGGFYSEPYDADGNGDWTIGFGHKIKEGEYFTSITVEEAYQLFLSDISYWETEVRNYSYSQTVIWNQNQFDAFVSLAYNSGYNYVHVMDAILSGANPHSAFTMIVYDLNGNYLQGLYDRRVDEANMFMYGVYARS